eukprot:scaffold2557_cov121-Cylindrotheca_fusiformis.AAC.38
MGRSPQSVLLVKTSVRLNVQRNHELFCYQIRWSRLESKWFIVEEEFCCCRKRRKNNGDGFVGLQGIVGHWRTRTSPTILVGNKGRTSAL